MNILCIALAVIVSVISTTNGYYYSDNRYYRGYPNYQNQYKPAYRSRFAPRKNFGYGRGYEQSDYADLHKPLVYPGVKPYPVEQQHDYPLDPSIPIPISPDMDPDYNWYKEDEMKKLFKPYPKVNYKNYFEGMTFYTKAKPIYVEKKPIIKVIKQPVYVKQPIHITKQPVLHKEEVVTINKKPPVVTEVKVPEVELKPVVDKEVLNDEQKLDAKKLKKDETSGLLEKTNLEKSTEVKKSEFAKPTKETEKEEKSVNENEKSNKSPELEDP